MGCFKSKRPQPPESASEPTGMTPALQLPSSPVIIPLYKPIPNTRSLLYCNATDSSAFHLGVSLPPGYKFRANCGIALSSKLNKIYLVGGLDIELRQAGQAGNFLDECVTVEVKYLTGRKEQAYPRGIGLPTLLLRTNGEGEDMYCVGGCQSINHNLTQGTPALMRNGTHVWEKLPEIAAEQRFCCPVAVLFSESIYCIGGFEPIDDRQENRDIAMKFDLNNSIWTSVQLDLYPYFGCLAAPFKPNEYLIFQIKTPQGIKAIPAFTISNGTILGKNIPDSPHEKDFSYPVFDTSNSIYVFSEDQWLYTFNKKIGTWTGIDTNLTLKETIDYAKVKDVVPKTCKYHAFHVEQGKNTILEFNVVTEFKTETKCSERFNEDAGICVLEESEEIAVIGGKSAEIVVIEGKSTKPGKLSGTCIAVKPGHAAIRSLSSLPYPQQGVKAVLVGGKIYALAGFSGANTYSQVYSQHWTPLNNPPKALKYPICSLFKQDIYLLSGEMLQEPGVMNREIYAISTNHSEWRTLAMECPLLVSSASAVKVGTDGILLFGGVNEKGKPSKECFGFDGLHFHQSSSINSQLSLIFDDQPCSLSGQVYLYSRDGELFQLDLNTGIWSDGVDEEEDSLVIPHRL